MEVIKALIRSFGIALRTSQRGFLFSRVAHGYPSISVTYGDRDPGFIATYVWLFHIIIFFFFLSWQGFTCVESVGPTSSYRIIWRLWEACLPHRCFFLVGNYQGLFVWGHPSLIDKAGPKVVAGEGEMDSRAHSTAWNAAHKCWTMADLWGGNGRGIIIRRSRRRGLLSPQVKLESSWCFNKYRSQGAIQRFWFSRLEVCVLKKSSSVIRPYIASHFALAAMIQLEGPGAYQALLVTTNIHSPWLPS